MTSVLQDWVTELPLRAQGTLLTGVRGCDVAPKDPTTITEKWGCSTGECQAERELAAFLRFCFMVPADSREVDVPGAFFKSSPPASWKPSQFGHFPLHWFSHMMHCFEIIGYCHPDPDIMGEASEIYRRMVISLHLNPETYPEMLERLTEDRIALGEVVS